MPGAAAEEMLGTALPVNQGLTQYADNMQAKNIVWSLSSVLHALCSALQSFCVIQRC
jgi:hypothetical protein